jgi:hypothetical protein
MAMDRPPGTGKGRSDQFFNWVGGICWGGGIERLGRGGSRFTDGGGSNDLLIGVCNVGIKGALL